MKSRNNPSVTMVMGNVSMMRMGLRSTFITASTRANRTAVLKLLICTPPKTVDKPYATNAVANSRIMKFMIDFLCGKMKVQ